MNGKTIIDFRDLKAAGTSGASWDMVEGLDMEPGVTTLFLPCKTSTEISAA